MNNNPPLIKTSIGEANQNRISETLSVEEPKGQASAQTEDSSLANSQTEEVLDKQEEEVNHEPEALSAPVTPLPPTSAAADAEAVSGMTIGTTYGDEGEIKADAADKTAE